MGKKLCKKCKYYHQPWTKLRQKQGWCGCSKYTKDFFITLQPNGVEYTEIAQGWVKSNGGGYINGFTLFKGVNKCPSFEK